MVTKCHPRLPALASEAAFRPSASCGTPRFLQDRPKHPLPPPPAAPRAPVGQGHTPTLLTTRMNQLTSPAEPASSQQQAPRRAWAPEPQQLGNSSPSPKNAAGARAAGATGCPSARIRVGNDPARGTAQRDVRCVGTKGHG